MLIHVVSVVQAIFVSVRIVSLLSPVQSAGNRPLQDVVRGIDVVRRC